MPAAPVSPTGIWSGHRSCHLWTTEKHYWRLFNFNFWQCNLGTHIWVTPPLSICKIWVTPLPHHKCLKTLYKIYIFCQILVPSHPPKNDKSWVLSPSLHPSVMYFEWSLIFIHVEFANLRWGRGHDVIFLLKFGIMLDIL